MSKVDTSGLRGDIANALLSYSPTGMTPEVWATVRERVVELVVFLAPESEPSARRVARILGYYIAATVRTGVDVTAPDEVMFDARRVEGFIAANPSGFTGMSVHELRIFRAYATTLNPAGAWPVRTPTARRHPRGAPYKGDEVPAILSAIKGLRRGKSRDRLTVAVNTVLGCGATAAELLALDWSAFYPVDGAGWMVALPGGTARNPNLRARVVPVAKPYIGSLVPLIGERSGPVVATTDANVLAKAINSDSTALRGAPPVTMARLRTTWMWERSRAGVSLVDIAVAAGVRLEAVAVALDGHVAEDDTARTIRAFVRAVR